MGHPERQQLQSASSDFNEVKNHRRVGHVSACGVSDDNDLLVCCWVVGAWGVPDDENLLARCYVEDFPEVKCYVLVERSARLELDGYDSVVWHVVLEASASDTR